MFYIIKSIELDFIYNGSDFNHQLMIMIETRLNNFAENGIIMKNLILMQYKNVRLTKQIINIRYFMQLKLQRFLRCAYAIAV